MAMAPEDVHFDQILTNISVGVTNEELVLDRFYPEVPVDKQTDMYYVWGEELFSPRDDIRAPLTRAGEIEGPKVADDSYRCVEHSLQTPISVEERANADAQFNADVIATTTVTSSVLLQREILIKKQMSNSDNYSSSLTSTLSNETKWSSSLSKPINNIIDWKAAVHRSCLKLPNSMVMSFEVMNVLRKHDDFVDRIKYTQRGILTEELVAAMLDIPNVYVSKSMYDNTNPGQKISRRYLWENDVVLAYVPDSPSLYTPAYAYEFVWNRNELGSGQVDRWYDPEIKGDKVRYSRYYDLKKIYVDSSNKYLAGYLSKAVIA